MFVKQYEYCFFESYLAVAFGVSTFFVLLFWLCSTGKDLKCDFMITTCVILLWLIDFVIGLKLKHPHHIIRYTLLVLCCVTEHNSNFTENENSKATNSTNSKVLHFAQPSTPSHSMLDCWPYPKSCFSIFSLMR